MGAGFLLGVTETFFICDFVGVTKTTFRDFLFIFHEFCVNRPESINLKTWREGAYSVEACIELNEIQTQCPSLLRRGLWVADGVAQGIYFDNVHLHCTWLVTPHYNVWDAHLCIRDIRYKILWRNSNMLSLKLVKQCFACCVFKYPLVSICPVMPVICPLFCVMRAEERGGGQLPDAARVWCWGRDQGSAHSTWHHHPSAKTHVPTLTWRWWRKTVFCHWNLLKSTQKVVGLYSPGL